MIIRESMPTVGEWGGIAIFVALNNSEQTARVELPVGEWERRLRRRISSTYPPIRSSMGWWGSPWLRPRPSFSSRPTDLSPVAPFGFRLIKGLVGSLDQLVTRSRLPTIR